MSAQYSKGYPRAVCSNCNKERRLKCTGLRRSEREAIRDCDHSWACCGSNVDPSIMQRNDVVPLQTEVKDAGITTGNCNEEVTLNLGGGGILCRMLRESEERSKRTSVCLLPLPL